MRLNSKLRFIVIVVLAVLATVVDSVLYFVSFLTDGFLLAALVWVAWGSLTDDGKPRGKENG